MNKYNWSIIGHKYIVNFFSQAISNNKLSHAYLFCGPEHIGKDTLAIRLAQILQCQNKKQKPCMKCTVCQQIQLGIHPDTQIKRNLDTIKIEEIRALQHNLNLNSYNSPYKIAIILNASRMTFEAQNAFLKTLEEPSGRTIIILTDSQKNNFLPTIISRCQIINFRNVLTKDIKNFLISKRISSKQADELAHLSSGRPGYAIKILEDKTILEKRENLIKKVMRIPKLSHLERFNQAKEMSEKGIREVEDFLNFLIIWFRDLLLMKNKLTNLIVYRNHLDYLKKQENIYNENILKHLIDTLERNKSYLFSNINPKLVLESVFLSFPEVAGN